MENTQSKKYSYSFTKKYSYSFSTNTIWLDSDLGEITAKNPKEAKEKAINKVKDHIDKLNAKLQGLDVIGVEFDNITIKETD